MPPRGTATPRTPSAELAGGELSAAETAFIESGGDGALPGDTRTSDGGADSLAGGGGTNSLDGGATTAGGAGTDTISAGAGADTVTYELPEHLKGKFVPHGAMHEERLGRQAAVEENKKLAAQNQILVDRTTKVLEAFSSAITPGGDTTGGAAAPAIPDIEKDPLGFVAYTLRAQQEEINQLKQGQGNLVQTTEQQQRLNHLSTSARNAELEFMKKAPDYSEATNFLAGKRHKQLELLGMTNADERHQTIMQDAWHIAANALGRGANPAEIMYEMAKELGYTPKTPAGGDDTVAAGAGADTISAAAHIAGVKAGQDANTSLSGGRGAGPSPITVNRLLEMSDADFDKAISTRDGRALMGA